MSDETPALTPEDAALAAPTPEDAALAAPRPEEAAPAPTPTPEDAATPPATTMRRICCVAAPRRPAPSLADQMRAAAVWAQLLQGARAAREGAQAGADDEQ